MGETVEQYPGYNECKRHWDDVLANFDLEDAKVRQAQSIKQIALSIPEGFLLPSKKKQALHALNAIADIINGDS